MWFNTKVASGPGWWVRSVVPLSAALTVLAGVLPLPLALALARRGHAAATGEASQ